jgi:hypothetical protein
MLMKMMERENGLLFQKSKKQEMDKLKQKMMII